MKLNLLAIILIFGSGTSNAQSVSSIDIIAGLDYSYRLMYASKNSSFTNHIKILNEVEHAKLNWRFGFNYNRKMADKVIFKTGIRLVSTGYVYRNNDLTWGSEHNGMGGHEPDPNLPRTASFATDYWFLEIPIAFRFEKGNNKFSTYLETGVSPSIYLSTLITFKLDDQRSVNFRKGDEIHSFNLIHLVGFFSYGVNYNLSEKIQLFAQPTLRFHFTSLVDAPISEHLYNGGIELGMRRSF